MANPIIVETERVPERSTAVFTITFTDEAGNTVVPTAAVYSLYDSAGTVVDSLSDQSFTSTIVLTGTNLAVSGTADETEVIDSISVGLWERRLVAEWTYNSDNGSGLFGKKEIIFYIPQITGV